ncbi:MAG: hypothetical protein IRZ05_15155 [Micromonosporaceae bacterium]|nr:hypothetical protein [Micromonosporaceae bacterium]
MNDLSTDQTLRTAFAELRAAERSRIRPPGADAAHRTVRRRRRLAAASATGGLTALVAIGAGYLATTGEPAPVRATTDPASVTTEASAAPGARLPQELTNITVNALGKLPPGSRSLVIAGDSVSPAPRPSIELAAKPGRFVLRLACGGDGTVTATVRTGSQVTTATARCATTTDAVAAGAAETPVVIADPGTAVINLPSTPAAGSRVVSAALIPR